MKSDGKVNQWINHQRRKPTFNEGNRQSTINSHRQSPTIANRFTYLLSAATISTIKMAHNIRSDNSKRSTTIGNQKLYSPKAKTASFIAERKWKGRGCRTYLKSELSPELSASIQDSSDERRLIAGTVDCRQLSVLFASVLLDAIASLLTKLY